MITKLDLVAVPSQDAERSQAFYVDALGLRADASAHFEFWVGETFRGEIGEGFAAAPAERAWLRWRLSRPGRRGSR
jgi:catechol 2,3-dioxygenase-like lactoylglutathione lyase family enzyme